MNYSYKRQNEYLGACYFVLSKKRFIEMAVRDGMAFNLAAEDQKIHIEEQGEKLLRVWEQQYRQAYTEMTNEILNALWTSFRTTIFLVVFSAFLTYCLGGLSLKLPFSLAKFISYVGSALVGWSALMQLGNDFMVWDEPAFPQKAHTIVFKAIFIPGVFLILLSVLL